MAKKLVIKTDWCKACEICVRFCPVKILAIENNTIAVTDYDKCIFCGQCELRCPDYAIYIESE